MPDNRYIQPIWLPAYMEYIRNVTIGYKYSTEVSQKEEKDMKEPQFPRVEIHGSKETFIFGSCAAKAICAAFGIQYTPLKIICSLLKTGNPKDGLTFTECKKIIRLLGEYYRIRVVYTSNKAKLSYGQLLFANMENKYLIMFDEHLSHAEYGKVYDSYISLNDDPKKWLLEIPTGWWKIG